MQPINIILPCVPGPRNASDEWRRATTSDNNDDSRPASGAFIIPILHFEEVCAREFILPIRLNIFQRIIDVEGRIESIISC